MPSSNKSFVSCLFVAALAVGCGGGGDAVPESSAMSFPLSQIAQSVVQERGSYPVRLEGTATYSGESVPVTGSGTVSLSTGSGTFEGVVHAERRVSVTGSVSVRGVTVPIAANVQEYYGADTKPIGRIDSDSYCVYEGQSPIPAFVKVGDSGSWYNSVCYTSSAKVSRVSTSSATYVIEPDSATTALLKLVQRVNSGSGQGNVAVASYRITSAGSYTKVSENSASAVDGVLLNLTVRY